MKDSGIALIWLGLLAVVAALFISVGRSTGYGEVANLHSMHIQGLVVQGGLVAFLAGVILYAAGTVQDTIAGKPSSEAEPASAVAYDGDPDNDTEPTRLKRRWWESNLMIVAMLALIGAGVIWAMVSASRPPASRASIVDPPPEAPVR